MRQEQQLTQEALVAALQQVGFLMILDTVEYYGSIPKMVVKGQCVNGGLCWDNAQGMTVVYDLDRRPWLIPRSLSKKERDSLGITIDNRGAYVPHIHDGGAFRRKMQGGAK